MGTLVFVIRADRKAELCPWRSAAAFDRPGIFRIMWKRIEDFCRSDLGILVLAAGAGLVLHVATNGQYGFHRDELQTLDDARHLDWGFVAYPPITPLIGRLELILFGTSLVGFRAFAAVAVGTIMVLAGLIAKELGGRRQVQLLAAVAA